MAKRIYLSGVSEVEVRNLLVVFSKDGVCVKCYGRNLATGDVVKVGEAVGITAAQSIGEPGTQLTMRTFHTGGVAGGADITKVYHVFKSYLKLEIQKVKQLFLKLPEKLLKSLKILKVENQMLSFNMSLIKRLKQLLLMK